MIKTGNPVISIYTEMTPNPETMKFVANKLLYPGKSIDFPDEESAKPSLLAQELFTFPFIKSVFIASNFVTLTKTIDTDDWQDVIPTIKQFLKDYLEEGKPVVNEEEIAIRKTESTNEVSADDDDVVKRIKEFAEGWAWAERKWSQVTDDTGIGDPSFSTKEKGQRFFEDVTHKIAYLMYALAKADKNNLYEQL